MTLYFLRKWGYIIFKGLKNLLPDGSRTVIAAHSRSIAWPHCVCIEGLQIAVSVRNCGSVWYEFFRSVSPLLSPEKRSGRANKQASNQKGRGK